MTPKITCVLMLCFQISTRDIPRCKEVKSIVKSTSPISKSVGESRLHIPSGLVWLMGATKERKNDRQVQRSDLTRYIARRR